MGYGNRNDLFLAVDGDGNVYAGQGWPAYKSVEASTPTPHIVDREWFFYSQRRHRCAWRDGLGVHVGTPTQAKMADATRVIYADQPGQQKLTGAAIWLGRV